MSNIKPPSIKYNNEKTQLIAKKRYLMNILTE